jgi:endonuclease/exonuclease/phosphatase family metal-dependent hydrolase
LHQVAKIINKAQQPIILGGDFNVGHESETDLLIESKLKKAVACQTFPSWKPKKFLDYIFMSSHLTIKESYPYRKKIFSDHLPFIAEIEEDQ